LSFRLWRRDPGPCIVCGTPHCACTADDGPIAIPQMPRRDGVPPASTVIAVSVPRAGASTTPTTKAEEVQPTLPEGTFTSGTYRGRRRAARQPSPLERGDTAAGTTPIASQEPSEASGARGTHSTTRQR